jgi:hypothetical protein
LSKHTSGNPDRSRVRPCVRTSTSGHGFLIAASAPGKQISRVPFSSHRKQKSQEESRRFSPPPAAPHSPPARFGKPALADHGWIYLASLGSWCAVLCDFIARSVELVLRIAIQWDTTQRFKCLLIPLYRDEDNCFQSDEILFKSYSFKGRCITLSKSSVLSWS